MSSQGLRQMTCSARSIVDINGAVFTIIVQVVLLHITADDVSSNISHCMRSVRLARTARVHWGEDREESTAMSL